MLLYVLEQTLRYVWWVWLEAMSDVYFFIFFTTFLHNFVVSNCCSSYYLVSSLHLPYGLGRDEG